MTPMNPDINRRLRALFDAHDEASRALRLAKTEMGTTNAAMIKAHDEALQAALAINRGALDLLEELSGDGQQG